MVWEFWIEENFWREQCHLLVWAKSFLHANSISLYYPSITTPLWLHNLASYPLLYYKFATRFVVVNKTSNKWINWQITYILPRPNCLVLFLHEILSVVLKVKNRRFTLKSKNHIYIYNFFFFKTRRLMWDDLIKKAGQLKWDKRITHYTLILYHLHQNPLFFACFVYYSSN